MDSQRYYDEIVERSCRGNRVKAEERKAMVPRERLIKAQKRYRINLKKVLISGIIAGMVLSGGFALTVDKVAPAIHESYQVSQEIGDNYDGFREQYVSPNTFRTQDANHYLWYDYQEIAKGLSEYGDKDFDMNLFYLLEIMDSKNVDEVLNYAKKDGQDFKYSIIDVDGSTKSRNFRHYLAVNNYYDPNITVTDDVLLHDDKAYDKAIDNFKDTMRTRISIEQSVNETERNYNQKMEELNQMLADHNMDSSTVDKGIRR